MSVLLYLHPLLAYVYMYVYAPTWRMDSLYMASYQVVIGSLDPEENHHQTCRQQLPEEQNDPKHDVGVPADFMHVCLQHTKKSKEYTGIN